MMEGGTVEGVCARGEFVGRPFLVSSLVVVRQILQQGINYNQEVTLNTLNSQLHHYDKDLQLQCISANCTRSSICALIPRIPIDLIFFNSETHSAELNESYSYTN